MGRQAPKGESRHRMRFYRRNFKRMYPKAGDEALAAVKLQAARLVRWKIWTRAAIVIGLVSGSAAWWWWVFR
jgi:hypothetical protein